MKVKAPKHKSKAISIGKGVGPLTNLFDTVCSPLSNKFQLFWRSPVARKKNYPKFLIFSSNKTYPECLKPNESGQ